jgi:hypothetical protein
VKQSVLGEYEENAREKQRDTNIQGKSQAPPLKPSHRDGNTKLPPQRSKMRRIEGFGENVN